VVNGTRRVSPEIERKVRQALDQIGYIPNEAARILKGNRSSVIGLIVPDLADPFFAELGNAVQQTAWHAGYMTLMASSNHGADLEASETELMVQRRVAGLLAVPIGHQNRHFADAQKERVPVIAIDRPIDNVATDTLTVDNFAASRRATAHLVEHGHKHILCLADTERIYTKLQRVAGYKRAMRDAKLTARVCLLGPGVPSVAEHLNQELSGKQRATAIFAESNLVAVAVLHELRRRGLRLPQDVALLCFDDFNAASLVTPAISVVQQPVAELGRKAAEMLLARLRESRETASVPQHIQLSTRLLIRESCGEHREESGLKVASWPSSSAPSRARVSRSAARR
jgi:LacI family transcriptional regulator